MATILLVEDHDTIREMFAQIFEMEGYKVLTAENGEEALKIFKDNNVDGVVSDLEMPRMGGDVLFESIQAIRETPMWIITGRDDKVDLLTKLMLKGLRKSWTKPVFANTILEALNSEFEGSPV